MNAGAEWPARPPDPPSVASPPSPPTTTGPVAGVLAIFVGVQLAQILGALDGTIVATALPTISSDLGGFFADHLGDHGLCPGHGGVDADLRQARRPVRPQAHAGAGDRGVSGRLAAVRGGPEPQPVAARPVRAGPGRRRVGDAVDGRARRRDPGPSAWTVDGLPGGCLRRVQRCRTAGWRPVRRPPQLALCVFRQPAGRADLGGDRGDQGAEQPAPGGSLDRLGGLAAARRRPGRADAGGDARRRDVWVDVAAADRACDRRAGAWPRSFGANSSPQSRSCPSGCSATG